MLGVGHLRSIHHCHRVVVDVCHGILGPPFGLQLDAFYTVATQVGLAQLSLVIGIESVELVNHHTLYVRSVAPLGLYVIVDELQRVVARHDTALVQHHGAHRQRAVAVTVEGDGLSHLLTLALRPYLHLQLYLADGRHDIDVVLGSKQLRRILRGVLRALNSRHADVERTSALGFVQSQHDILLVARLVYLVVETHGVLGCRVVEQGLQRIHIFPVVLDAVVYLLPLELADVCPQVQLGQVDGTLYGETVSPCCRAGQQQRAEACQYLS